MHGSFNAMAERPKPQNIGAHLRKAAQEATARALAVPRMDEDLPFSFSDGSRWYAVMTNIRCEERAQHGLHAKGFRTFLPTERRWVRHARVRKAVSRPLLSRYLFVETDPNVRGFMDIRLTDGVEAILANCEVPAAMPDGLIEEFIRRQLSGEFDSVAKGPIEVGARIRIMDGPHEDFFATVVGIGKRSGGEILAQLLGSKTRQRFALISVRPA